jgi:hypothetical protein
MKNYRISEAIGELPLCHSRRRGSRDTSQGKIDEYVENADWNIIIGEYE